MKRMLIGILAVLCGFAVAHAQDRKLGTTFEWEQSIDNAAARAGKEGKLVLVLHVSGHFDKPDFT
jgi:hypothetical protein